MKCLCLIRHAKSSWDHPNMNDLERPLEPRGIINAGIMGSILNEKNIKPDIIFASTAQRTRHTAQIFAKQLSYDEEKIIVDEKLYEASVEDLLTFVKHIDKKYDTVIIVGHNPGLSWLANYLSDQHVNLTTCGIFCIDFDSKDWESVTEIEAENSFVDSPQNHVD